MAQKTKIPIWNVWLHYWGTTAHKCWVCWYIFWFCFRLLWRSVIHDWTKYGWVESKGFFRTITKLKGSKYGSPGYQDLLDEIKPSLDHHYAHWSHHPQHFQGGYSEMSLEDLVEMFCDWRAAVRRHATGDIRKSIEHNKGRFGIHEDVCKIMENTLG